MSTRKRAAKINALSFAKLIGALRVGGLSLVELAKETGLHPCTVSEYVYALRREHQVYIEMYAEDTLGRMQVPVYKLGQARDAKRNALTRNERQARYRAGVKMRKMMQLTAGVPA